MSRMKPKTSFTTLACPAWTIDRDGNVVKRFHPTTTPEEIDAEIAKLL